MVARSIPDLMAFKFRVHRWRTAAQEHAVGVQAGELGAPHRAQPLVAARDAPFVRLQAYCRRVYMAERMARSIITRKCNCQFAA